MSERKEFADVEPEAKSHYNNRSGQPGNFFGNKSKFTPNQTQERIRIHAIAIATGEPTFPKIVEYWKEKFDISITVPSEREWRQSNLAEIERRKSELIEKGEINIPVVSEEALADSMMTMVLDNARSAKNLKLQIKSVLSKIDINKAGTNDEVDRRNNELIKIYKILDASLGRTNENIENELTHLFTFSSKIKIKDKQIKRLVDDRFDRKAALHALNQEDDISPFEEVSDEMRAKLLPPTD